ncbi:MAG: zinc ribbon domain-containing protein [Acidobacteria bacterium]|nr:zinc ribbon domain-containing protein [Acidobacteriota bacterium]
MQQSCRHCGYESPISDRFCRQCGASLASETEVSGARTRNYGRQEPSPTYVTGSSGHLPPSVADAIAGETERYYQAPAMPVMMPPQTAQIKPQIKFWRWIVLLFVLLLGTTIGALVMSPFRDREARGPGGGGPAYDSVQEEAQRRQEEQRREMEERIAEAEARIREAQERQQEAVDRAREAAEQAVEAGTALAPTNERLLDLRPWEYPDARVASAIRIPRYEMLSQRTTDSIEKVSQFYQKKLGDPIIQINEEWEKRLLYQSNTDPQILVSVTLDDEHPGQLKIVVLRSPFRSLPRLPEIPIPRPPNPPEPPNPR